VGLNIHSPVCLHEVVLNYIRTGTILGSQNNLAKENIIFINKYIEMISEVQYRLEEDVLLAFLRVTT
jgi:hypothetical protein